MFARKIHHLSHLGFGDFIREYPAYADAALMNMEHHARGFFHIHFKKLLKAQNDEFHRRIIIVEHQHFIRRWLFGSRAGARGDANIAVTVIIFVVLRHANPYHPHFDIA